MRHHLTHRSTYGTNRDYLTLRIHRFPTYVPSSRIHPAVDWRPATEIKKKQKSTKQHTIAPPQKLRTEIVQNHRPTHWWRNANLRKEAETILRKPSWTTHRRPPINDSGERSRRSPASALLHLTEMSISQPTNILLHERQPIVDRKGVTANTLLHYSHKRIPNLRPHNIKGVILTEKRWHLPAKPVLHY